MPKGFLPNADAELRDWSANFSALLSASPEAFGVSPEAAAEYAAKNAAYAAAFQAASDPATRTRSSVIGKNQARAALRAAARRLALIVKSRADVTDAQRVALGLAPRAAGRPAAIARPAAAPSLIVVAVTGHIVRLRLLDADSPRRGRPPGVLGAVLFSFAAPPAPLGAVPDGAPPTDLGEWRFEGHASRTSVTLDFPAHLPPGTQVWLTARWLNPRLQAGPAAPAVSTHLGGNCGGYDAHGLTIRMAA